MLSIEIRRLEADRVEPDPNDSKVFARGAMALGVAKALGEGEESAIVEGVVGKRLDLFSAVASTSASGDPKAREVLPFGNATRSASAYRMAHGTLEDVIDADGIRSAFSSAGSKLVSGSSSSGEVAAAFAKAEASPSGRVRGWRNTMLSDADIDYERHARAALGAVIASRHRRPGDLRVGRHRFFHRELTHVRT